MTDKLAALAQARQDAQDTAKQATADLRDAVLRELRKGEAEAEVARRAQVNRMTVRKWRKDDADARRKRLAANSHREFGGPTPVKNSDSDAHFQFEPHPSVRAPEVVEWFRDSVDGRDVWVQSAVWLLMGGRDNPTLERHVHEPARTGRDIDDDVRVPLFDDPDKALIWALREAAGLDEDTPADVAARAPGTALRSSASRHADGALTWQNRIELV